MGMHIDPVPSGRPEWNENEMVEQNVEREYREAMAERDAEGLGPPKPKPSLWKRLFGGKDRS